MIGLNLSRTCTNPTPSDPIDLINQPLNGFKSVYFCSAMISYFWCLSSGPYSMCISVLSNRNFFRHSFNRYLKTLFLVFFLPCQLDGTRNENFFYLRSVFQYSRSINRRGSPPYMYLINRKGYICHSYSFDFLLSPSTYFIGSFL